MTQAPFTLLAPAKLNLCLHITGRREDGYHELQTLFQLLDYGDEVTFHPARPGHFALRVETTKEPQPTEKPQPAEEPQPTQEPDTDSLPPLADNLISRAARLLLAWCKKVGATSGGAEIHLHKRLPIGAGLGGGSSDAATCLLGLRQLWGLSISSGELADLGLGLGADVPLFVKGHSAWGQGIGEWLKPVLLPPRWYLVLTPECSVSTAQIFAAKELPRNSAKMTLDDSALADILAGQGSNDCEPVTCHLYPPVAAALEWLKSHSPTARMSGTGGAVFAAFSNRAAAESVLAQLPPRWRGFVARGINQVKKVDTGKKRA